MYVGGNIVNGASEFHICSVSYTNSTDTSVMVRWLKTIEWLASALAE